MTGTVETAGDIRPFHVDIPDAALEDLCRRVAATNWPERERPSRRAACHDPEARALWDDGLRLAHVRGG